MFLAFAYSSHSSFEIFEVQPILGVWFSLWFLKDFLSSHTVLYFINLTLTFLSLECILSKFHTFIDNVFLKSSFFFQLELLSIVHKHFHFLASIVSFFFLFLRIRSSFILNLWSYLFFFNYFISFPHLSHVYIFQLPNELWLSREKLVLEYMNPLKHFIQFVVKITINLFVFP